MNTFNGEEMAGRKILVREDREDRDVKQYNKENGIERPEGARPPRRARRGGGGRGDGPPGVNGGEGRPGRREARNGGDDGEPGAESSGLQVSLHACRPALPSAPGSPVVLLVPAGLSLPWYASATLVPAAHIGMGLKRQAPKSKGGLCAAGGGAGHSLEVHGRGPDDAV